MKSIKLYLDEDIDPLLAKVLRERGHDVLTVHEAGKRTLNDRKQLEFAISQGRTFFTHNIKHFVRFSQEYSKSSKNHFGIIVSDHLPFKELLKRTLRMLERHSKEDISNRFFWLQDYK
ncbi:MAG: hypothetical protein SCARUB_04458 [Candidatus Scalindua rubra]|uniref:DUF5615 domain-containing protein n=1 Tax=Candidatus Scalindua rubra TaxID=1872076 RepID=A0A1E3X4G1_9BACT|nr:MAG: hypothetical protein SCARUB_04458 [Candidatus Scalindua rubra]